MVKTVRDLDRAYKRLRRLYLFFVNDDDRIQVIRRAKKPKKKKKKLSPSIKYGIKIPRNVQEAIQFDRDNESTLWQDAIQLEMGTLIDLDCFEFKEIDYDPGEGWQRTTLHIVFDKNQDFRRKARLVVGGHLVDILDHQVYAFTIKSISVQLLHMIAHKADLKQLCGDITNAFVTAHTNEKKYFIAHLEFGAENKGRTTLIRRALYGLASSAERFLSHLANTL